jgi:outer membrane protein assembly factor BamB
MRRIALGVAFLVLLVVLLVVPTSSNADRARLSAAPAKSWLAYGHDAQLTNFVRLPGLTTTTARRLRQVWSMKLDGPIIASPLFASGGQGGLPRSTSTLFVATEAGSLYAIRPSTGAVRWKRTFGVVIPAAQCSTWGISSTGAIDLKRRVIYVISADGWLHALDLATGAEKTGWPVAVSVARNDTEYVWGGLRLLRNLLYVPVASYCDGYGSDGLPAEGRLVAIDVDRAAQAAVFDPVPGHANLGGLWGWGGVSVGPGGQSLYAGIGNSWVHSEECNCYIDDIGYGVAMVKLSPDLRVLGWDRPRTVPNVGDVDFGTAPLLFQPRGCPPLAAANNKIGRMYVWNRNRLSDGIRFQPLLAEGPASFVGQPSYSPALRMIFVSHVAVHKDGRTVGDGVIAYSIDNRCRFRQQWLTRVGFGNEPPPLIIGDVVFAPGGDEGGYTALAARTGRALWRFPTPASTYAPPIAAGGWIFGGELDGTIRAFARGS